MHDDHGPGEGNYDFTTDDLLYDIRRNIIIITMIICRTSAMRYNVGIQRRTAHHSPPRITSYMLKIGIRVPYLM